MRKRRQEHVAHLKKKFVSNFCPKPDVVKPLKETWAKQGGEHYTNHNRKIACRGWRQT